MHPHELLHIAFNHLTTFDLFKDKELANIAMDMEINQYIDKTWLPKGGIDINDYPDLNEFEYSALKSCLKKLSMEGLSNGQYIEVAFSKKNIGDAEWKTVEKILHFQEQLLITVYDND